MGAAHELAVLIPRATYPASRPERACELMEGELAALARDIESARRSARRAADSGLDLRRARRSPAEGEHVELAGGRVVAIRPIRPADARALTRTFASLSEMSRFRRFLAPIERLSPRQLHYLTHVDHWTHEALIAFDADSGEGVGVARYVRERQDPRTARFAVVVADGWHRRGVAGALLERLQVRAREDGIDTLCGATVAGNPAARRLRGSSTLDPRSGTLQLTLPVTGDPRAQVDDERRGGASPRGQEAFSGLQGRPQPAASAA
jgi:hypothetical protein